MLADRQWFRQQLAAMSDSDLLAATVAAKRHERTSYRRGDVAPVVNDCWYACLRWERPELFEAALRQVKEEEAEHRAANRAAWRHLQQETTS